MFIYHPLKLRMKAGDTFIDGGYHELNGTPTSASSYLMTDILRREWNFDGFVVSDWGSIVRLLCMDSQKTGKMRL